MPNEKENIIINHAAAKVNRFVARFEESYRRLVDYAALPLILTPELVHYLRQQFLPATPWVAEVDLLLSELCREAGYETYIMTSDVRAYGLSQLRVSDGGAQMQQAARLLLNYVQQTRHEQPEFNPYELEAQRWAALAYLDDGRAKAAQEIADAYTGGSAAADAGGSAAVFLRLSRLVQELAPEFAAYPELVAYAQVVTELLHTPARVSPQQRAQTYRVNDTPLPDLTRLTLTPQRKPTPIPSQEGTIAENSSSDGRIAEISSSEASVAEIPSWEGAGVGSTWTEPVTGMEFVWVPAGRFMMGQTDADRALIIKELGEKTYHKSYTDELPRHEVIMRRGFWLGKYPVTQAQWRHIMGANPSHFNEEKVGEAWQRHPVEQVSWNDVQTFVQKLNTLTPPPAPPQQGGGQPTPSPSGRVGVGWVFRLPSEAEWEYACRAGSDGLFCYGDDVEVLGEYAWFAGNSDNQTHPVGQKQPNAWGVYDMHGNVWEWVADTYHENYKGAPTDGSVWMSGGSGRVLRGGSWNFVPRYVRSAVRGSDVPARRSDSIGFRLLRTM